MKIFDRAFKAARATVDYLQASLAASSLGQNEKALQIIFFDR